MNDSVAVSSGASAPYDEGLAHAQARDAQDPLAALRTEFAMPAPGGTGLTAYLAGNSLGLQPLKARQYIEQELDEWARLGVEGHGEAVRPWIPYHEHLTEPSARLVGAGPGEVVVMNTLTVNLHLMLVSFYRPTPERHRILIEASAFPSDQYAVDSQTRFHGFDPGSAVIEARPRSGEYTLRTEDLVELIEREGQSIALVLLGDVNYLTGQAFDIEPIARAARASGCVFGLNLAHGAGNCLYRLHDWDVDFAVWCSYKYLNGGPGNLAGCFVHERHAHSYDLPRFAGWWGQNKQTRFRMERRFDPMPGAEGWQLSNPPILQMAALRASLEIFDRATMPALRAKSERLTGYLEFLLDRLPKGFASVVTPRDPARRGAQLSIRVAADARKLQQRLKEEGIICDFREPDIVRAAPAPLYCRYVDVYRFYEAMNRYALLHRGEA